MVDYGTDISDFPDLDPVMPDLTGRVILLEAIYRRLSTPNGSLFYDPDYGYDLTDLIGEAFDPSTIPLMQAEIVRECLKDERLISADVGISYDSRTQTIVFSILLRDGFGPFRLVLSVDKVSLSVLKAEV